MSEYSAELYTSPDAARRAGWRHRLEAALRYEVALSWMEEGWGVHLLDVGCGPGGLLDYLRASARSPARYTGVDVFEPAVRQADAACADARRDEGIAASVHQADARSMQPDASVSAVVSIGALVTGEAFESERARRRHVRAHFDGLLLHPRACGVCVVLDQDALQARAWLAAEPALCGVRRAEVEALMQALERDHGVKMRADMSSLSADILVAWSRRGRAPERREWPGRAPTAHHAVLGGPWGRHASHEDRAWLLIEVGELEWARETLDRSGARDDARHRALRERLEAIA